MGPVMLFLTTTAIDVDEDGWSIGVWCSRSTRAASRTRRILAAAAIGGARSRGSWRRAMPNPSVSATRMRSGYYGRLAL